MGRYRAKNDPVIDKLIADPLYDIREDGTVWTLKVRGGTVGKEWREIGRRDKEGYVEIWYAGKRLKRHRVVYRKFHGPLDRNLVVDHKNAEPGDDTPNNLRLATHEMNAYYRERRRERLYSEANAA
jgi:hypothetical protein